MACDVLDQFIRRTASTLVDPEHVTWSEGDVTDAVSDGLAAISSHRPDLYTDNQEITLKPGSTQPLPSGVIAIIGDIRNLCVAEDGTVTEGPEATLISEDDLRALAYYSAQACPSLPMGDPVSIAAQNLATNSCKQWQLTGYAFDPRNPSVLQVTPAVPEGIAPKLRITIQICAPCLVWPESKVAELPCKYRAELKEYVLYSLLSKQRESEAALADANRHLVNFYNMLGVKYRQESRFASGYYIGAKGDGDQAVIRG